MTTPQPDDARTASVYGVHGRDAGKTFTILEIDPLTTAGYALRFNSALRIESYLDLFEQWQEGEKEGVPPIDEILRTLQGADPIAVHTLITEMLDYVLVSPDPQHPGVNRPLMKNDIRELKTLGEILSALVKLNFAGS